MPRSEYIEFDRFQNRWTSPSDQNHVSSDHLNTWLVPASTSLPDFANIPQRRTRDDHGHAETISFGAAFSHQDSVSDSSREPSDPSSPNRNRVSLDDRVQSKTPSSSGKIDHSIIAEQHVERLSSLWILCPFVASFLCWPRRGTKGHKIYAGDTGSAVAILLGYVHVGSPTINKTPIPFDRATSPITRRRRKQHPCKDELVNNKWSPSDLARTRLTPASPPDLASRHVQPMVWLHTCMQGSSFNLWHQLNKSGRRPRGSGNGDKLIFAVRVAIVKEGLHRFHVTHKFP